MLTIEATVRSLVVHPCRPDTVTSWSHVAGRLVPLTLTPILRNDDLAEWPESVGYATFAGTTVVFARTRPM